MKTTSRESFFKTYQKHLVSLVLVGIVGVAAFIRFDKLATLPSTLNRDEAALAYNAFLLSQTGKDEWGRSWPVSLESFGDYKLPGYPLLLVTSFKAFGYNDFAVRFPSAVAGTVLVILGYLFASKILQLRPVWSLWVAAAIALQPVFFFYSRMAWEANVGLAFFVSGILFLFWNFSKNPTLRNRLIFDGLGGLFLFSAIFTYNTPLLLLPCVAIALLLQRGVKNWQTVVAPLVMVSALFVLGFLTFSSISQQKSGITIFSDETLWRESVIYYESFSGIPQKLIGNRYVFFFREMVQRYIDSFSMEFLVKRGGQHPWHNLPGFGHLYLATYLLSLVGVVRYGWQAIFQRKTKKGALALTVMFLLLTSLLPSVITVDAPHATRSLFFFFMLCLLSGVGFDFIWKEASLPTSFRSSVQAFFIVIFLLGFTTELQRYYFHYFTYYPEMSRTILKGGLPIALQSVEKMTTGTEDQVAIVDPDGFLYISVAWELKLSPEEFFKTINHHLPDRIGLKYGYRVGRYRFIAQKADRTPEDKHLIEWNSDYNSWVIDQ